MGSHRVGICAAAAAAAKSLQVIDISPGNLDSSLCFIQPGILHRVLCIPSPPHFPDSLAEGPCSARCAVSGNLRGRFLKGCCFPQIPSQASSRLPSSSCLLGDGGQRRAGVCALGDFFQQLPQPLLPPFGGTQTHLGGMLVTQLCLILRPHGL